MALPPKDKPPLNQRPIRPSDRRPRQTRVQPGLPRKNSSNPLVKALLIIGVVFALVITLLMGYAFLVAKPNLPKISALTDYNPKTPLRIYTADKVLIGEFGEERRKVIPLNEIPQSMRNAVLAIEDDRFYSHGGVDYVGILRAAATNLRGHLSQGASTITMQVARNFFLSNEKTFSRKIYEVLLAWEIESQLTKDKILEIYMNQIFLVKS